MATRKKPAVFPQTQGEEFVRDTYRLLLDRYGIDPAGALYIDDAEANIRAGAELGLRVWHYFGEDRGA